MGRRQPRKHRYVKYRNEKVTVDDHTFASRAEAARYRELKALERAGEIEQLELQPKFPLACGGTPILIKSKRYHNGRRALYTADFRYVVRGTGETVVEDVKGFDTGVSRLRRAIVEAEYGITVVIVR